MNQWSLHGFPYWVDRDSELLGTIESTLDPKDFLSAPSIGL